MYIKEIKEKYPLVYERIVKQTSYSATRLISEDCVLDVNNTLVWSHTKEGSPFWQAVHEENFEEARDLMPHLFVKTNMDRPYAILSNGLYS